MQRLMNIFPPFVERFHEAEIYLIEHRMIRRNGLGSKMMMPKLPLCAPLFTVRSESGCDI